MPKPNPAQYDILRESDIGPVARLLGDIFSQHEPLALAVGQPAREVEAVVSLFGPKLAAEQLSVIARDSTNRTILGAVIAHDFASAAPSGLDRVGECFDQIASLLDRLEESYLARHRLEPGRHAHVFMVGVRPEASGRGIARQLIESVVGNATARGYEYAFTEATSTPSQHAFRAAGFRDVDSVLYRTFDYRGRTPFASVLAPPCALLMERELERLRVP